MVGYRMSRLSVMCGIFSLALTANSIAIGPSGRPVLVKVDAAATKIDADDKQTVTVTLDIEKTWHVYANPVKCEDLTSVQTFVRIRSDVKLAALEVKYPAGKLYRDERFPSLTFMYYDGKVSIPAFVQRAPGDNSPLTVEVCFLPASSHGNCQLPTLVKRILP